MIPLLLAMGCLTGIQKNCPHPTPIMNYQLKNIWSPTNPFLAKNYENGTWVKNSTGIDMRMLVGQKIRVALVKEAPFVNWTETGNNSFTGVARTILGVFRETLGFDWELVFPGKGDNDVGLPEEGVRGDNVKFSGVLGMLQRNEADIAVTYVSMLPERVAHFDFSRPFGEEKWMIMMSRPQETTDGDGLIAPFQPEVWYYLLICLVLMGPLCYAMIRFRCWLCKGHHTLGQYYGIGSCVWFVYGALMKQGSVLKPMADSTRILFATWWIFVTILTAFYTANLTAYLTLSKVPIPYDRLEKIGYRDKWIVRKGDTMEYVLKSGGTPNDGRYNPNVSYSMTGQQWPEFKKVRYNWEKYGKFLDNYKEIIEIVRRQKYLLLDEESRVQRIVYRDFRDQSKKNTPLHKRCAFIMSKKPVLRIPYGMAFKKGSPLKRIFDPILDKLTKAGLFHYWKTEDLPTRDPCNADSDFRERQLRNGDLMTTYCLCGTGYLLGFITFLCECAHKYIFNKKMNNQLVPAEKPMGFYKGNLSVPPGAAPFFDTDKFLQNINGRDYVVMKTPDGRTKLVPKNNGLQALQPVYNPPPPITYSYMT